MDFDPCFVIKSSWVRVFDVYRVLLLDWQDAPQVAFHFFFFPGFQGSKTLGIQASDLSNNNISIPG